MGASFLAFVGGAEMTFFKWASLSLQIAYYKWALSQMCASHEDVPAVTLLVMYLEEQRAALGMGAV
jgi:hypothetical protein